MRQALTTILVALLLTACARSSDEEQIAENISEMQAAVEAGKFASIRKHLHGDFMANNRLSAEEVKRMLQMYSLQHKRINVTVLDSETTMDPALQDRAETLLSVALTGSSGLLPSDGSIRKVTVDWEKHGDDWLVVRAEWRHY